MAVVLASGVAATVSSLAGTAGADTASPPALTLLERATMLALARSTTVTVSGLGCGSPVTGSGVVVDGVVLTSRHLVEGGAAAVVDDGAVRTGGGLVVEVDRLATGSDLAGLVGSAVGAGRPVLEMAGDDPGPGEPVLVAADWGQGFRSVPGRVQAVVDGASYGTSDRVLLLDAPTGPGFSGGPVLDRRGRLVGLAAAIDHATGLSIAVPASVLAPWLDGADVRAADTSCITDRG